MDTLNRDIKIEFISLYGHLTYSLSCPQCEDVFEKQTECYPSEIICPFCKSKYIPNVQSPFEVTRSAQIIYHRKTS